MNLNKEIKIGRFNLNRQLIISIPIGYKWFQRKNTCVNQGDHILYFDPRDTRDYGIIYQFLPLKEYLLGIIPKNAFYWENVTKYRPYAKIYDKDIDKNI